MSARLLPRSPDPAPLTPVLARLCAAWRAEAEILKRRGATLQAEVLMSCVLELEAARQANELEEITFARAAAESGYSSAHLHHLFPGQRRVRRGDLPRKARVRTLPTGEPDLVGEILEGHRQHEL